MSEQLDLFISEEQRALDLAAEFIYRMGVHTFAKEDIHKSDIATKAYYAFIDHPAFRAAEDRRQNAWYDRMKRISDEVEKWPAWKTGSRENIRK